MNSNEYSGETAGDRLDAFHFSENPFARELPTLFLNNNEGSGRPEQEIRGSGTLENTPRGGASPAAGSEGQSVNAHLPPVEIHHTGWLEGTENVAGELVKGAWEEVTEHPGRVLADAAIGFGIGVGMTLASPGVVIAIGAAGAGLAAYEVATHVGQWYHDASVVARPELHDLTEVAAAKKGVQSFGGGAVDVAAGVAGGVAGAKFAQSEVFANLKDTVTDTIGKTFSQTYFDSSGRPIKLPLPNDRGSAFIKYDQSGQISELHERTLRGWDSVLRRQPDGNGGFSWIGQQKNVDLEVASDPVKWEGSITLSPDNKSLTLVGQNGTEVLRAGGSSSWTETAEQKAVGDAWAAKLKQQLAQVRRSTPSGAGAAAMGLGMMIR